MSVRGHIVASLRLLLALLVVTAVALVQFPGPAQASAALAHQDSAAPCQHMTMAQDTGQAMSHSRADCTALGEGDSGMIGAGMIGDCAADCALTCTSASSSMIADQPALLVAARGIAFEQNPYTLGSPAPLGSAAPPPRL